jgi:chromosome segregation protein
MQDVIFNGTNTRKPASRSSVELVFDNADHRAGGQWSQFAEIAVKRVLTRDGTSSYYINNQPVRRRDVQDVFLGTGLGPRAYAIIGQGTISRIIESKPEELRLFLEEAAGVSKYKERRRETENRLGDTRENLTRVEDILRELNANLEKLEKQAEVAARYNALQADVTLKQHQLWFLKRTESEADQAASRPMPTRRQRPRIARRRPAPHRERARDRAPGPLRRRRPGQPGAGPALRSERRSGPAGSRDPLRGRRPPARRAAAGAAEASRPPSGPRARKRPRPSSNLAALAVEAEEQAMLLAAQVEEQGSRCPTSKTRCAQAQAASTSSAAPSRRCSSRSRCWPPTSATSKNRAAS